MEDKDLAIYKVRFCNTDNYKVRNHTIFYNNEDNGAIVLADGTSIEFVHDQDCCETVYADLSALYDTGFIEDMNIRLSNLKIEKIEGYGVRINGYGIPCYDMQNGYYSDDIDIIIKHTIDASKYGEYIED